MALGVVVLHAALDEVAVFDVDDVHSILAGWRMAWAVWLVLGCMLEDRLQRVGRDVVVTRVDLGVLVWWRRVADETARWGWERHGGVAVIGRFENWFG